MGIFELIYGSSGQGTAIFGAWYLVAFFILAFFLFMLLSQGVSAENIVFFVLAFFLLILGSGLFELTFNMIITPIVIIILYIAFIAFNIFNK